MIPAYSRESIRATLEPAHTFDKILVLSVSKSTIEESINYILHVKIFEIEESIIYILQFKNILNYTIKDKDSHFLQFRVHNSEGTVITNGGQEAVTEMERNQLFKL